MAHDTDPLVDPTITLGTQPRTTPQRRRRGARRWSLVLFAVEVAIVVALVWYSWAGGSWG